MEEVDLEPDCNECKMDAVIEITDVGEQTNNSDSLVDIPNNLSSLASTDVHTNNEAKMEIISQDNDDDSEMYCSTEITIEVTPDVFIDDESQLLSARENSNNFNSAMKIEKIGESNTDILASNTEEIPNTEVVKLKNKQSEVTYVQLKVRTGEKPFSCKVCEYRCVRKSHMIDHLRIHTGEKPFSCNYCSYRSTQKAQLKRHLLLHTGEKPFSCEFCEFGCTDKSNLEIHSRIHSGEKPFLCKFCEYRCTRKSQMTDHVKIHTGEKPFSCNICNFRSRTKSNLKTHLGTHTDKKLFECEVCGTKFKRRGDLRKHTRKFH